jgi:hypothetical protein
MSGTVLHSSKRPALDFIKCVRKHLPVVLVHKQDVVRIVAGTFVKLGDPILLVTNSGDIYECDRLQRAAVEPKL